MGGDGGAALGRRSPAGYFVEIGTFVLLQADIPAVPEEEAWVLFFLVMRTSPPPHWDFATRWRSISKVHAGVGGRSQAVNNYE